MQESKNISEWYTINAKEDNFPMTFKKLNYLIKKSIMNNQRLIKLDDVCGQRFIGAGLECSIDNLIELKIHGTPGNDLGIFMDGPKIKIKGNTEDQIGNTMNGGSILVDGDTRDVTGFSMRGGKIYVKGNAGYRVGIHMKEYQERIPIIVIGGSFKEFFGEYMAGGILVALGLRFGNSNISNIENFIPPNVGNGIHGGKIYIRGKVPENHLGIGTVISPFLDEDYECLKPIISEFSSIFEIDENFIWNKPFTKIIPGSHRPYASYYTAKAI